MEKPTFDSLKEKWNGLLRRFPENEFPDKKDFLLRTRRAISWLGRAEAEKDADVHFIFLWVCFNALYARLPRAKPGENERGPTEWSMFNTYFETLVGLGGGANERICAVFDSKQIESEELLDNRFVFADFWNCQHYKKPSERGWKAKKKSELDSFRKKRKRREAAPMLKAVFSRIYVMRNQMMHGSTAKDSELARLQLQHGTKLMESLLPIFIDLMLDEPGRKWGAVYYPRVLGKWMDPL